MAQVVTSQRGPVTGTAVRSKKRKPFLLDIYSTAVGKKYVMGGTGIGLMGFVLFHMIGNLKMYAGAADLDHYAHFLQTLLYPLAPKGWVLWILRGGLISMLALHLHAAYSLTVLNRKARPVKYQSSRDYQIANFASRTMRLSGIVILAFVAWHLLDLTFGVVNSHVGTMITHPGDEEAVKSVYASVVHSFDRTPVALFYVVANILLGIHLFHGAWSIFQSFGWNNPRFNKPRRGDVGEVGQLQVRHEVGQPEQQAQVQGHRRRDRSRRCVGSSHARRTRVPGGRVHLP
ncbi:MAG: succinate dehydrogenase [Actinobacteria bacterium]|nr:succinate dehydrogenase [Actinomycetota bacterium]